MRKGSRKWRSRAESALEYLLAFMFIQGGIKVFLFSEPLVLPGIFMYLVGQYAIYLYGLIFFLSGAALAFAKFKNRKKWHKYSLMAMYLECIYVIILSTALNGLTLGLSSTFVVAIASGYLWLQWKFKTEYIDPKDFFDDRAELRE